MNYRSGHKAFTLVELMVVIVVFTILAGLLMLVLQHMRESGRASECSNNLKQLATYAGMYRNSNRDQWCSGDRVGNTRSQSMPYVRAMGRAGHWSDDYRELASEKGSFLRCPSIGFKTETGVDAGNPTMEDWFQFQAYPSIYNNTSGEPGANWAASIVPFSNPHMYRGGALGCEVRSLVKIAPTNIVWFVDGVRPDLGRLGPQLWAHHADDHLNYARPFAVHGGHLNLITAAGSVASVDAEKLHGDYYVPIFGPRNNVYGGLYSFSPDTCVSGDDPKTAVQLK